MAKNIEVMIEEIAAAPEEDSEVLIETEEGEGADYSGMIVPERKRVEEIVERLEEGMQREEARREAQKTRIAKFRRQLDGLPEKTERKGPVRNPSNVVPPLAMIHGQEIGANIHAYFSKRKPFWTASAIQDETELHLDAKLWTKYLGILCESKNDLDFDEALETVSNEAGVMPLCFLKVPWTTLEWNFKTKDEGGTDFRAVTTTFRDGPQLIPVPIEDVLYPSQWKSIYQMPWIAHEFRMPEHQVRAKAADGSWRNVERILDWTEEAEGETEANRSRIEGKGGTVGKEFSLAEIHFYDDVDEDGRVEDLIWVLHRPSGIVLRQDYNLLGVRQWVDFNFIARSRSIEGRGTGQICETLQDEAEGLHNTRNDSIKLASVRMLAMRRAVFMSSTEDIYNGKIWQCDVPKEDIAPIQLSEVYPSSLDAENWTWAMASRATGAGAMSAQPNEQLGSRDTYRGQALRSEKAGGIFSASLARMSRKWSEVAMLVVFNLIKNRERVIANETKMGRLSGEEISRLDRMLAIDVSEVPQKFRFRVRTTDLDMTYEAIRQNVLSVNQLQAQYMQTALPLAMQVFGPTGAKMQQDAPGLYEFMLKMLTGQTKLLETIFQFFEIKDTENYLPDTERWERVLKVLELVRKLSEGGMRNAGSGQGEEGAAGLVGAAGGGSGVAGFGQSDGGTGAGSGGGGAAGGAEAVGT